MQALWEYAWLQDIGEKERFAPIEIHCLILFAPNINLSFR